MKKFYLLAGVIALLAGCAKKTEAVSAGGPEAAPAQSSKPGHVVLPPDSPKLSQIRVEEVVSAAVPLDEVDAPGKIEVNPNRVSNVTLPVTGRIVSVLVHLGDAQVVAGALSPFNLVVDVVSAGHAFEKSAASSRDAL